jgi:hypothetical protein
LRHLLFQKDNKTTLNTKKRRKITKDSQLEVVVVVIVVVAVADVAFDASAEAFNAANAVGVNRDAMPGVVFFETMFASTNKPTQSPNAANATRSRVTTQTVNRRSGDTCVCGRARSIVDHQIEHAHSHVAWHNV